MTREPINITDDDDYMLLCYRFPSSRGVSRPPTGPRARVVEAVYYFATGRPYRDGLTRYSVDTERACMYV